MEAENEKQQGSQWKELRRAYREEEEQEKISEVCKETELKLVAREMRIMNKTQLSTICHKRMFSLMVGLSGTKEEKLLVCITLRQSGKCRVTN